MRGGASRLRTLRARLETAAGTHYVPEESSDCARGCAAQATSPSVKAIFILDSDGNRVCAKYYDKSYPTQKEQLALEKKLHMKTKNSNARLEGERSVLSDVILIENIVSVYRCGSDTTMHVIGSAAEVRMMKSSLIDGVLGTLMLGMCMVCFFQNELILLTVLDSAYDAVSSLLNGDRASASLPTMLEEEQGHAWGRFTIVSKHPAEESDHIYFSRKLHQIGRNPQRCDIVINKLFRCVSLIMNVVGRNGVWVNADRVGKGNSVLLQPGFTIHFTKPGATPAGTSEQTRRGNRESYRPINRFLRVYCLCKGVTPLAYKFELLYVLHYTRAIYCSLMCSCGGFDSPDALNSQNEDQKTKQEVVMISTGAESPELVQPTPCTQDNTSPSEKKRRRVDEEAVNVVVVSSQELEEKLRTAENQVATLTAKASHLELAVQSGSSQLEQEKKALAAKLEAATAENLELKSTLTSKEQELKLKLEEAAEKYNHQREAERKAESQEMDAKLKEATKKYQQRVEAEHYEQRREMSQKMAAFAHESDKLQTELVTKEEALTECEEKIAELEEQLAVSKRQLSMKETELAEFVEKISELEDTLNESKEENSEMIGLLAAAEEKVAAAEEKASRAAITAAAAASNSNGAEARERQQLQEAIAAAAARYTLKGLRARLAAALDLFGQVQALGLHGMRSLSEANASELGDLRLLSNASVDSQHTPLRSEAASISAPLANASTSATSDGSTNVVAVDQETKARLATEGNATSVMEETKEGVLDTTGQRISTKDGDNAPMAEPKAVATSETTRPKKKKASKQEATLSAVIETDAASAIAAMASADSSAKSSPSETNAAAMSSANHEDGDWEMLE
ncbi:hypothetical protein BBJ28_00014016 [Nothophytophthora sp. Chile5]|nr:hypothetical protein BBJ28_00014016 [Nothophytophthora sp. Chile5]